MGAVTYNSVLELFDCRFVFSNFIIVLVGGHHWHSDGDSAISLLKRYVDLLLEFLHVKPGLDTVLHEREINVSDHSLEALEPLLRLVFFHNYSSYN